MSTLNEYKQYESLESGICPKCNHYSTSMIKIEKNEDTNYEYHEYRVCQECLQVYSFYSEESKGRGHLFYYNGNKITEHIPMKTIIPEWCQYE